MKFLQNDVFQVVLQKLDLHPMFKQTQQYAQHWLWAKSKERTKFCQFSTKKIRYQKKHTHKQRENHVIKP